jgi:hypothetical protein
MQRCWDCNYVHRCSAAVEMKLNEQDKTVWVSSGDINVLLN